MRAPFLLLCTLLFAPLAARGARLKDLADVQGVRENELFGYGLVVGLAGTGDTERVFFTSQSISGMLGRLGIRVDPKDVRSRNVAAVMVTARLPTFSRAGTKLDVAVSSIGNARALSGGVLLVTPLAAADGKVYATAQGALQVGGYSAGGAGSFLQRNQPNSGRVPGGAIVERSVTPVLGEGPLVLDLKRPDFSTASRIAAAINGALGKDSARALDPAAVEVKAPAQLKLDAVALMAKIESLDIEADARAKVVVSERTGTVVAGEKVRIHAVAIAHGGLQISVSTQPLVSQPAPFGKGTTVVAPVSTVTADEESRRTVALPATASVSDLAKALNMLGATPRDLVSILQAMAAAGALDGDLEVI